ncbi:hypothetical protein BCR35DRAFT_304140 [Leucosporidium creatinivorum]|uniref:Uncharacterized protein n=1 Tax=Leucosporidium creatinivorum TaxID=106004 RepID=A0A1Y2FBI6_9BASI|nr:hypothetical protein BCR35DRAFT_304140 [Leucosporidium creatinivorum]
MSALAPLGRQLKGIGATRLALVVACSLALVLLHSLASGPASSTRSRNNRTSASYLTTSLGSGCSSPWLLSLRNQAAFWTASLSPSSLLIQPKDNVTYYNCPELSLAVFSLRLHYSNGQSHLISTPLSQLSSMGLYSLPLDALPPAIRINEEEPAPQAEVEILLEFGFYPGAASGQPCAGATCQPAELSRMGVEWSGGEVLTEDGERVKVQVELARREAVAQEDLEQCPTLSPLPPTIALVVPRPITWVHLLGDSNLRHLIPHLARPLGLQHCTSYTRKPEPYPTEWMCHDGSGGGVVLTFAWWFLTTDQNDALNLGRIDLSSLSTFLSSIPFPSSTTASFPSSFLSSTAPTSLTHLFISLGSHAPLYTTLGLTSALTKLLPAFATQVSRARTTSFLPTTAVNPAAIPQNYGPQAVMRNNVMLKRTHEVLQRFVEGELSEAVAQGRGGKVILGEGVEEEENMSEEGEGPEVEMLDVFSLSAVVPTSMMVDSVHFKEEDMGAGGEGVYDAWARIMWTAVERRLGDERLEEEAEGVGEEAREWEEEQSEGLR